MTADEFNVLSGEKFPWLTEGQLSQFAAMEALYRDWNARINVISRKDIDGLYLHHVLHSLAIAAYVMENDAEAYEVLSSGAGAGPVSVSSPTSGTASASVLDLGTGGGFPSGTASASVLDLGTGGGFPSGTASASVLDLGTGGGFPGIPLAVLFPKAKFTLCDSVGKKIKVVEAVASALGLTNVIPVHARAESLAGRFDYIVSRAVTSMDNFYPWVRGRYNRAVFYLKGGNVLEEISAMTAKYRVDPRRLSVWDIRSWHQDEYFDGKFLIALR